MRKERPEIETIREALSKSLRELKQPCGMRDDCRVCERDLAHAKIIENALAELEELREENAQLVMAANR
jgi:bacterioferritin-associated ferredoxin